MRWSDAEAIARALHQRFPSRDPLTIRLPDLYRWVPELEGFEDSADLRPGPRDLEQLQERWYRVYEQRGCAARQPPLKLGSESRKEIE